MTAKEIILRIEEAKVGKEVLDIWQGMHGSASTEDAIKVHQGAYDKIMQSLEMVYPPEQKNKLKS
tara:strand:- start:1317 stop:1511 length:195 start_codon:yes stop_codon:yes gene_type:complete